jgi:predicted Zn-dependent protease
MCQCHDSHAGLIGPPAKALLIPRARTPTPRPRQQPVWRRATAALLALSLALAGATPVSAQVRLPALGESASDDLSISAERRIGLEIMREARRDPAFLDDPILLAYVQSLWDPLVAAARQRGEITADSDALFAWEIFLVLDRSVNAFALPGGYVGVHLGLINITQTRDQLASVLAHELAHVTQRHIARSIAVSQRSTLLSIATTLLGILVASRSNNSDAAGAAIYGGQAAAVQGQLNFSRDMEREADRIGFGMLGSAGFSTSGMAGMFERMDVATRLNDNGSFPYLRSHPLTLDRISEARSRTLLPGSAPPGPPLLHALMQARARVLMDTSAQSLQRLSGETSSPALPDRLAALYAGAMAASIGGDAARAERQVAEALRLAATSPAPEPQAEAVLRLLQAQVRLVARDPAGALQLLVALEEGRSIDGRPTAGLGVDSLTRRPALVQRAQAALVLHQQQGANATAALRASTEALQIWLADHPHDAGAWLLMSSLTEAAGLRLRSLRAAAEARAAVGDLTGAIDRLRAGQSAAQAAAGQDFIEASVIDARLRQLQAQRRELAIEARGGRGGPREGMPDDEPLPPQ